MIAEWLFKIHCGNTYEFMPQLPDETIDLIVTSPRYNVGKDYGTEAAKDFTAWGEYYAEMSLFIQLAYQKLVSGGVLAMVVPNHVFWNKRHPATDWQDWDEKGGKDRQGRARIEPLAIRLMQMMWEEGFLAREPVVWVKGQEEHNEVFVHNNAVGSDNSPRFRSGYELILLGSKKTWHHRGGTGRRGKQELPYIDWLKDVWFIPTTSDPQGHPAPFPIEIPRRLLHIFTRPPKEGEPPFVVYDPFAGAGTTLLAAAEMGENVVWLGSEANPVYAQTATEKLRGVMAQGRMVFADVGGGNGGNAPSHKQMGLFEGDDD